MKTIEYYMNLPYRLELVPDTEEGGFVASYPELRGCLTSGETAEKKPNRMWLLLAAMGPGIVTAMAGNDAGGIST